MKPEELMIGDWVSYKGKMPCKITAICKDTAVVDNDTEQDWRIDYDKLTSIPLTAEILEKNFPKKDFVYWEENEGSELYHIHIERCFQEFNGFLKYVHELQHALKLCGIDKDIEI